MNIINPIKLFLTVFFITHFAANHCMVTRFKHEPMMINSSYEKETREKDILWWMSVEKSQSGIFPQEDITKIRNTKKQEEEWTCFAYAVNKITNGTAPLKLYANNTSNIEVEKFFKQTQKPQENGLAIYTPNKNDRRIKHFAVIITPEKFESKFGLHKEIFHHKPLFVPDNYGNAISFWTLKEEFTSSEGKKELHEEINKDILRASGQKFLPLLAIESIALGVGLGMVLGSLLTT